MSRKRKTNAGKRRRPAPPPRAPLAAPSVRETLATAGVTLRPVGSARPAVAAPVVTPAAPPPPPPAGAVEAFVARNAPEVVGVTYWFDPPPQPSVQAVTLRLVGRRLDLGGESGPRDRFVHEETWTDVLAGSGPVAVTTKIRDVTTGEWQVDAHAYATPPGVESVTAARREVPVCRAAWSWRRWRVTAAPAAPVKTRLAPLVHPPAVLLGSWPALVVLGIVLALVTQSLVLAAESVRWAHTLTVSLLGVLGGAVGAKGWYVLLHRTDGRRDGWAIQGFVAGLALTAPLLLWLLSVPVGAYLDASAPALLFGMATGRIGCFLTGCCAGRPTVSRWGVWSSNRTVAARRIPVQPLESLLAATVGVAALAVVLTTGAKHGAVFVAALAAYTLIRQSLLLLREEQRRSRHGTRLIAAAAATALAAAVAAAALT